MRSIYLSSKPGARDGALHVEGIMEKGKKLGRIQKSITLSPRAVKRLKEESTRLGRHENYIVEDLILKHIPDNAEKE